MRRHASGFTRRMSVQKLRHAATKSSHSSDRGNLDRPQQCPHLRLGQMQRRTTIQRKTSTCSTSAKWRQFIPTIAAKRDIFHATVKRLELNAGMSKEERKLYTNWMRRVLRTMPVPPALRTTMNLSPRSHYMNSRPTAMSEHRIRHVFPYSMP